MAAMRVARGGRCDSRPRIRELIDMNTATDVGVKMGGCSSGSALAEFEQIYRANVGVLTAYFARRSSDPQTVADLTSETIVRAAGSFAASIRVEAARALGCSGSPPTSTRTITRRPPTAGRPSCGWPAWKTCRSMRSTSWRTGSTRTARAGADRPLHAAARARACCARDGPRSAIWSPAASTTTGSP